jgi:hypothetical protein
MRIRDISSRTVRPSASSVVSKTVMECFLSIMVQGPAP